MRSKAGKCWNEEGRGTFIPTGIEIALHSDKQSFNVTRFHQSTVKDSLVLMEDLIKNIFGKPGKESYPLH